MAKENGYPKKAKGVGKKDHNDGGEEEPLTMLVAKLSLNTAQRGRDLEATAFQVWEAPKEHPIVQVTELAGKIRKQISFVPAMEPATEATCWRHYTIDSVTEPTYALGRHMYSNLATLVSTTGDASNNTSNSTAW